MSCSHTKQWTVYLLSYGFHSVESCGCTYLHAGSPTSLKNTHVPPFKQNAFPITGHVEPELVHWVIGRFEFPVIIWNVCIDPGNDVTFTNIILLNKCQHKSYSNYSWQIWVISHARTQTHIIIYDYNYLYFLVLSVTHQFW